MYTTFVFLLYSIALGMCSPSETILKPNKRGVATIKSQEISRPRQSAGSGRLSLTSYRFIRQPKKKHLDIGELKMVLGTAYDSRFMSIEPPRELQIPNVDAYVVNNGSLSSRMLEELQASNMTQELQLIAGGRFIVGQEYVKTFEKWLLRKSSCPVK